MVQIYSQYIPKSIVSTDINKVLTNTMTEGETLRNYIDNQRHSKIAIARDLGISKQTLFQYFKSHHLEVSTKDRFEKYFGKEIFKEASEKQSYQDERRSKKNGNLTEGRIPVYEDAPFTLTSTVSYRDVKTMEPDFWVTIPGLRNCNYGCRATGDSMHPLIRNQALVVGEEITDPSFILYGEIYIIQTRNNIETVKYIQAHETDKSMLVLVPFNTSATKTPIKKKDILKLYRAKAVFNVL